MIATTKNVTKKKARSHLIATKAKKTRNAKELFEKELQHEFKTVWKDIAHESKDMMNKETHKDAIKSLETERMHVYFRAIDFQALRADKPFDENIGAAESPNDAERLLAFKRL